MFVKNHQSGKAYEMQDHVDSSFSASDSVEDAVRDMWKDIDLERHGSVTTDKLAQSCKLVFGLEKQRTI